MRGMRKVFLHSTTSDQHHQDCLTSDLPSLHTKQRSLRASHQHRNISFATAIHNPNSKSLLHPRPDPWDLLPMYVHRCTSPYTTFSPQKFMQGHTENALLIFSLSSQTLIYHMHNPSAAVARTAANARPSPKRNSRRALRHIACFQPFHRFSRRTPAHIPTSVRPKKP